MPSSGERDYNVWCDQCHANIGPLGCKHYPPDQWEGECSCGYDRRDCPVHDCKPDREPTPEDDLRSVLLYYCGTTDPEILREFLKDNLPRPPKPDREQDGHGTRCLRGEGGVVLNCECDYESDRGKPRVRSEPDEVERAFAEYVDVKVWRPIIGEGHYKLTLQDFRAGWNAATRRAQERGREEIEAHIENTVAHKREIDRLGEQVERLELEKTLLIQPSNSGLLAERNEYRTRAKTAEHKLVEERERIIDILIDALGREHVDEIAAAIRRGDHTPGSSS
jgi:hypothetical protein